MEGTPTMSSSEDETGVKLIIIIIQPEPVSITELFENAIYSELVVIKSKTFEIFSKWV